VHVYIDRPDGVTTGIATTADRPRPDVGAVFPSAGPGHGFHAAWDATGPGTYNVCAFGIPLTSLGTSALLGCIRVNVP
jgi:hypothetical protein